MTKPVKKNFDRVLESEEYLQFAADPKNHITMLYCRHEGRNACYRVLGYEVTTEENEEITLSGSVFEKMEESVFKR